jgi:hypothetical protein
LRMDVRIANIQADHEREARVAVATTTEVAHRALESVLTQSPIGKEMGWAGIEDCTEEKLVAIAL